MLSSLSFHFDDVNVVRARTTLSHLALGARQRLVTINERNLLDLGKLLTLEPFCDLLEHCIAPLRYVM